MFAELDPSAGGRDEREEAGVIDADLVPADAPRSRATGAPMPDATIEQIDRQGAEDGFTPFTIAPGALAALAGEDPPSYEEEGDGAWPETRPPQDETESAASYEEPARYEEPELALPMASQPTGPGPRDYTARLAQARGHRDSGALDDAIVEYRTVVRNAPELLPDVLADVESCLAERPEHPELHRLLGDARIRQGDYLGALESYNRAVALTQSLDN
jgi:tetratricopeptide (TPR) repeat protein